MNSKGLLIQRFHSKYATSDLFHVDCCFIMSCMNWQQLILNAKIEVLKLGRYICSLIFYFLENRVSLPGMFPASNFTRHLNMRGKIRIIKYLKMHLKIFIFSSNLTIF